MIEERRDPGADVSVDRLEISSSEGGIGRENKFTRAVGKICMYR